MKILALFRTIQAILSYSHLKNSADFELSSVSIFLLIVAIRFDWVQELRSYENGKQR